MNTATLAAMSDEELWQLSRAGDREAFGRIVERHQSLVCALAYSVCGSLARSEDLAQETFLAAWQRLGELREPAKLRAWLCGIVRHLAAGAARRERRRGGPAEPLDDVAEPASAEAGPAELAITQEEAALLWRSLAGLPGTYREPLVLFYRQGRSVAEVADALELSEDAVKQRLARGRALLRDELAAVVESTLARTGPGAAFTVAVLVALPMVSGTTASAAVAAGAAAGTAISGGAETAGRGLLAKLGLGVLIGPVIGLACAWLGTRAAASTARSPEERRLILRYARGIIAWCLVLSLGLAAVLGQAGKLYTPSAGWIVSGIGAWTVVLVGGILLACRRLDRESRHIREATNTTDEAFARTLATEGRTLRGPRYFESKTRLLGLPVFAMAWGGASSDQYRPRTVCAWIAVGDIAVSPFVAFGGFTVAPISVGAVSVGVLALSVFWGVAVGVLAVGSLAFGWWALGCAAAGVRGAVGFAAVARDYAVGFAAGANEAGTAAAKDWLTTRWPAEFVEVIVQPWPWWVLGGAAFALGLRAWCNRRAA
ncbi:MAG: sigma-70 family RNA polymerase sigma factor [Verrucomicrobiales bacterium]|nr:sigma-70 family RNA polymerase sigma factor [Verrucomicrobiales bacterium]